MFIADAFKRFDTQLDADGRSKYTRAQYRRHIGMLANWANENACPHVEDLTTNDIAQFLTTPTARQLADGTPKKATSVNALRSSLRVFCAFLFQADLVANDPAKLVRRAITETPPPRALQSDEAEKLFAVIRECEGKAARRDEMLFTLLLATGVRLSSALKLSVDDLQLNEGSIRVWAKRDRVQVVYLPTACVTRLRAFVAGREGPVFVGPSGRELSPRTVQRRFSDWREMAGISKNVSPHSLRHCFATELYRRTHDVLLVRAALGHASLSSSLIYTRVDEGRLREALEGF